MNMKRLVMVEDDITLAEMYKLKLELDGYECNVAFDGLSGLQMIQDKLPDLVLLDMMLPQLSGAEILHQMRESEWGKDLRVIIMTNISESESPELLLRYKFDRYIVKANQSLNQVADIIKDVLDESAAATA